MLLNAILARILTMTVSASVIIAIVIVIRLLLRRVPRIFCYVLWIAVLLRLLCPVSFETEISVFTLLDSPSVDTSVFSDDITALFTDDESLISQAQTNPSMHASTSPTTPVPMHEGSPLPGILWICGAVLMILHGTVQYLRLIHRLNQASLRKDGFYLADHVNAPFVIGFIRPRIYLPSSVQENEWHYIIQHERHHIRRLDHVFRLLGYLALSVHWFNPLVWLAFRLSGTDMEISCDEAIIRQMEKPMRADYAASLLKLSARNRFLRYAPLSFGEANTKKRILHIAQYKNPGKPLEIVCTLFCILLLIACISNPKAEAADPNPVPPDHTATAVLPENSETSRLRAITGDYLGTWYLSGTNDVTLELSEEYNAAADTYKLFFGFSKMAPKMPFVLPYETLEQQMLSIGIEFEDGTITVISGGMPYVFVREQGTESVTAQFPHLTAMGRWYLEDNTAGYIDIFTDCRSMNYDRCLAIKYANFDPYDMEYRHGSFWTEPGGLLYSGCIFGDEKGVSNQTIWFHLGTHSMELRCFNSPLLSIAETTFVRMQN